MIDEKLSIVGPGSLDKGKKKFWKHVFLQIGPFRIICRNFFFENFFSGRQDIVPPEQSTRLNISRSLNGMHVRFSSADMHRCLALSDPKWTNLYCTSQIYQYINIEVFFVHFWSKSRKCKTLRPVLVDFLLNETYPTKSCFVSLCPIWSRNFMPSLRRKILWWPVFD